MLTSDGVTGPLRRHRVNSATDPMERKAQAYPGLPMGNFPDGPLRRRQLLRKLLIAAPRVMAGAALLAGADHLLRDARTAAAAAKPSTPPRPPRPGDPPDKQGKSPVTVAPDDPAITAGMNEYPGLIGTLLGYVAAPRAGATYPGVLVLHDSQGLTEHYKDITRRFAKAGYVALAPDMLSRSGGTQKIDGPANINAALTAVAPGQMLQDLNTAVRYLESYPLTSKTRIGTIGFGIGVSMMWLVLANHPDPKAAVAFFGNFPPARLVSNLKVAVLALYGANDRRDEDAASDFEAEMKKAGLAFTLKLEPKAGHDFFDDTTSAYVPEAAKDAWAMTLDWFAAHLSS
jgi:carboxymethylenebutenolidase